MDVGSDGLSRRLNTATVATYCGRGHGTIVVVVAQYNFLYR